MTRVAIYGGGIVAMSLALALHQRNYDVCLWRPQFALGGDKSRRVFALNQQSIDTLTSLGVDLNRERITFQPVEQMLIWDKISGANISFNAADIGRFDLTKIINEQVLWEQIWQRLQDLKLPVIDAAPASIPDLKENVWYLNGEQADFLCIADGARSKLREQLNVPLDTYAYHQTAIVAEVKVSGQHQGIAFQVFGPHGPLAFLPISNEGDYSIVWSLDDVVAQNYLQLVVSEFKQRLYEALDGHLGQILCVDGIQSYPLTMLHAKQYTSKNWLLAGDTAHHFHPLAGLGLNMGIGDVACIWQLTEAQSLFSILGRYQRQRKSTLTPVILGMKLLKNCFGIQNQLWVKFRSTGMDFLDHQSLLKKLMMGMIQNI